MDTKVINAFGSPGSGKSSLCYEMTGIMKRNHISCELVTEVAKTLTWSSRHPELAVQPYVFGKQLKMIEVLQGKVEYIITDSPILLSYIYAGNRWPQAFKDAVIDTFNIYDNRNFLLTPGKKYDPNGRNQTKEESDEIYSSLLQLLVMKEIPFIQLTHGNFTAESVVETILRKSA